MRILKLHASFGKLRGSLELQEGFQLIYLPNEAGKSTWSAFLTAMLYGIDTSERSSTANQGLPAKERYKPWDGGAMEGSVELFWQGRYITIERKTERRVPMGAFRAYETHSGLPVTELTGDNCGKLLCGVERSVFERTAFIRQLGLTVTEDAALEKRLGALVTTGEDGAKTYLELEKELRSRKTKLAGRSGRIGQLSGRIGQVQQQLSELKSLQEQAMELSAAVQQAQAKEQESAALLQRIENAKAARKRAGLAAMEQELKAQEQLCSRLEQTVAELPTEEQLHRLSRALEQEETALQTARMDAAFGVQEVLPPTAPRGFEGLSAAQVLTRAREDQAAWSSLCQNPKKPSLLLPLLCLLALVGGICLSFFLLPAGLCLAGLSLAALLLSLLLGSRQRKNAAAQQQEAAQLALRYGREDCAQLTAIAEQYASQLQDYEAASREAKKQELALSQAVSHREAALQSVLEQIRSFAPRCQSTAQCREALHAAIASHGQYLSQSRALSSLRQQYDRLRPLLQEQQDFAEDAEALELDEAKIAYEQRTAAQSHSRLSTELAQIRGALSAQGDWVQLSAELEQLEQQMETAQLQAEVLDIAMESLKNADEALRSRFSPQITKEAGQLLSQLTGEKYSTLLLDPKLRLYLRQQEDAVLRPAAAMSCGTADQMYLALRLAMCRQLLPSDVPLILDDALVNFDEERAAAALELLRREGESRQVIVFTCRKFQN